MLVPYSVDILIVGAGPVGLLIGYQLRRAGCSVLIVEKDDKMSADHSGRANGIFARSAELLDQLGLADELVQQSHFVRRSYTYDENGKRVVPGRVWNFVENIEGTKFDFGLMLRQHHIEKCFRDHFVALGGQICLLTECIELKHTDTPDPEGNLITAILRDLKTGADRTVKSKYLVGADGSQSFVRRHFNVCFEGDKNEDKWIRIDGKIRKTDMPTPRDYASLESLTHGNVLWAPLDRGITRIGYVLNSDQEARNGGKITEEIVVKEALEAVKPFHIEYEKVTWWTLYVVRQRVAETYQPHKRVILAGDACHTHSSGAAQGLNTGIHDACNLAWKLALVIKGLAKDKLLETYSSERQAAARRLIDFDRKISMLMANRWPEDIERPADKDINQVLADIFDDSVGYNTGLGISYEENLVNVQSNERIISCSVTPGSRAPDMELYKPGTLEIIRLHTATPNWSSMYLLSLVGNPRVTLPSIPLVSASVQKLTETFTNDLVRPITIVALADTRQDVEEALGVLPCGKVYYDIRASAHHSFGVDIRRGALVVLRPDGYVGFSAEFSPYGVDAVGSYLRGILVEQST